MSNINTRANGRFLSNEKNVSKTFFKNSGAKNRTFSFESTNLSASIPVILGAISFIFGIGFFIGGYWIFEVKSSQFLSEINSKFDDKFVSKDSFKKVEGVADNYLTKESFSKIEQQVSLNSKSLECMKNKSRFSLNCLQ